MATLTIGNKSVTVDDSFRTMSPEQQNAAVEEIAKSIGVSQQAAPQGIIPGWTPGTPPTPEQVKALAGQYGKTVSGQQPPGQVRPPVSAGDAAMATVNGLTGSIPGLQQASDAILAGGQTAGDMATGKPVDFGARFNAIQGQRKAIVDKAPLANTLGGLGGGALTTSALSTIPALAEAMGMGGTFGKQVVNSGLFSAGVNGLQGLAQGHTGASLLADEGVGAGAGVAGSLVGQGLSGLGGAIANKITQKAQNGLISDAVVGSGDLAGNARGLFHSAVDDNPIQVTSDAYHRFLSTVQNSLQKFRPNADSNQPVTGMLQKLYGIADDLNSPGSNVAVDLKDLHIFRQEAGEIAQKGGTNGAMGTIIVKKIDGFINSLKPSDVAGGADPSQAAHDLMQGIADWSKAQKVGILQSAVDRAQTLKSDAADNLKTTFSQLMRSDDYSRFSPAEKTAIQQVAKGTSLQNIASIFGKMGINPGEGPKHILGASAGTTAVAALLAPLGPLALPAAVATTTGAGMAGRKVASDAANHSVSQAIRAATAGNIPLAAQAPNVLRPPAVAANLLTRGAVPLLPRLLSGSASTNAQR